MTGIREEAVEAAEPIGTAKSVGTAKFVETAEVSKNGKQSKGEYQNFAQVPCICYPINFGKKSVSALLDLGSEVNTVHPAFAKKLGLPIRPTDVGARLTASCWKPIKG